MIGRTTTWVTAFSDRFFSNMLSDSIFVDRYAQTLRERSEHFRNLAIQSLDKMQVPYENANAGVFLWIDLSHWISAVLQDEEDIASAHRGDPEIKLTRYLMSKGVYLQPGGVSSLLFLC